MRWSPFRHNKGMRKRSVKLSGSKPYVQVVSRIFSPEPAAASFRLEALVKGLAKTGVRVRVLTTIPAPGNNRSLRSRADDLPDVSIKRVQAKRDSSGYIRGYFSYLSFDIPAFFRLLFSPVPEVYVSEPPPTTGAVVRLVAALKRRPYVYYAADIWSDATRTMKVPFFVEPALRMVERFALRGAAAVITPNPEFEVRCNELGSKHTFMIRNGIDVEVFTDRGNKPDPTGGANPDGDWLVYAGTASTWQGSEVFVKAFSTIADEFPSARLLFLGSGPATAMLRELSERVVPGRVFFSKVPMEQAAAWQRNAKAVLASIQPGIGYEDAYLTKVFAGLACETPVIYAGPGPAVKDIERFNLGIAVPWDETAVSQAMSDILSGKVNFSGLRDWTIRNHSIEDTGRKAAEVVKRLLS